MKNITWNLYGMPAPKGFDSEMENLEHEEIMSSDCLEDAMAKADLYCEELREE